MFPISQQAAIYPVRQQNIRMSHYENQKALFFFFFLVCSLLLSWGRQQMNCCLWSHKNNWLYLVLSSIMWALLLAFFFSLPFLISSLRWCNTVKRQIHTDTARKFLSDTIFQLYASSSTCTLNVKEVVSSPPHSVKEVVHLFHIFNRNSVPDTKEDLNN